MASHGVWNNAANCLHGKIILGIDCSVLELHNIECSYLMDNRVASAVVYKNIVLARYGPKGKQYNTISHKVSRYNTIRCINVTSNLTRSNTGISSSMNVCFTGCKPGRYSRTMIPAKQPTWACAQTISNVVGWSAMSIGDNAISAPATMATPPWLTDRLSQLYAVAHDQRRCISDAA